MDDILTVTIKATEQYFPVVLFNLLLSFLPSRLPSFLFLFLFFVFLYSELCEHRMGHCNNTYNSMIRIICLGSSNASYSLMRRGW